MEFLLLRLFDEAYHGHLVTHFLPMDVFRATCTPLFLLHFSSSDHATGPRYWSVLTWLSLGGLAAMQGEHRALYLQFARSDSIEIP